MGEAFTISYQCGLTSHSVKEAFMISRYTRDAAHRATQGWFTCSKAKEALTNEVAPCDYAGLRTGSH